MGETKLGKYDLKTVLGKGAMGTVYEGWDPMIARRVAIKTVRLPDPSDEEAEAELGRFKREAQAAGRLTHPNIVGVFDYGETGEIAYIVMEFVDGRSLKEMLEKEERFPLPEVVRVMEGLLDGLAFSHKAGVVHRDIKPANIMITTTGQVKIADFGIARIESSSMTQAGTIMGTPAYMSPEQFMGQTVDLRTDIYSSGVVLYQMLTGERPFTGSMSAIMHKALNTEAPAPSALSVTAPRAFDAVVRRAMARRPEDRYQSAPDFAQALRTALTAPAVEPVDEDATMVATGPRPAPPPPIQPPAAPPPAPPGSRVGVIAGAAVVVLALAGGGAWYVLKPAPAVPAGQVVSNQVASPQAPATPPPAAPAGGAAPVAPDTTGQANGGSGQSGGEAAAPPGTPAAATSKNAGKDAGLPPLRDAAAPPPPATQNQPGPDLTTPISPPAEPSRPPQPAEASGNANAPPAPQTTQPVAAPAAPPATSTPLASPAQPATTTAPPPATAQPATTTQPAPTAQPTPTTQLATAQSGSTGAAGSQQVATLIQPPPEIVAPAKPTPAQLRDAVSASLAGLDCSFATALAATSDGVDVSVLAGSGAPADAVRRAVDAAAGQAAHLMLASVPSIYCPALTALTPVGPSVPRLDLSLASGKRPLRNNEVIAATVIGPSYSFYTQLDYVTRDDKGGLALAHLAPNSYYPRHAASPGSRATYGEPIKAKAFPGYTVGPPFGTDLIIAIASETPLFPTDPDDSEPAERYLARLGEALAHAKAAGRQVSVQVVEVNTKDK